MTIKRKIQQIYSSQRMSSRKRNHPYPTYSNKELVLWMYDHGYEALYNNWKSSGFERFLAPSCDRLDDSKGYSFDNIRLVTWKENFDKARADHRLGNPGKQRKQRKKNNSEKTVIQSTLKGHLLNEYVSQQEASEKTGVNRSCINNCCNDKRKRITAGGFLWSYK